MPDTINPLSGTATTVKISELPVAAAASDTDQLEANQAGTTRSITVAQIGANIIGSGAGINANVKEWLKDPTSAKLAAAITDETGTGQAVFSNSPVLTGDPQAPTPATSDNDTSIATTAYVRSAISTFSPAPDLSGYLLKSGGVMTGVLVLDPASISTAPTAPPAANTTQIANTAFVRGELANYLTGVTAGTGITVTGSAPSPTVAMASTITAGGPTGSATTVPVITWNARGQLTAVTTATITIPPGTTISDTPPGSPTAGQLWWNSTTGRLYIFYSDPNSSQWVDAAPAAPVAGTGILRLYDEQVLSAAATQMEVAVPTNAKLVELQWTTSITGATNASHTFVGLQSGTVIAGANYNWTGTSVNSNTPTTALAFTGTNVANFGLGSLAQTSGYMKFLPSPSSITIMNGQFWSYSGPRINYSINGDIGQSFPTITSYRLTMGTTAIAGSFLRCFVVT